MVDIKPMGASALPKGQKGKDKLESLYKELKFSNVESMSIPSSGRKMS